MQPDAAGLLPFPLECNIEGAWMFLLIWRLSFYLTGSRGKAPDPPRKRSDAPGRNLGRKEVE